MKKKGFTLIELIAVIVILAIITLIAVPIISKVVDKARKGAAEASALNYIDAVEKYVILHDLDSTKYPYDLKNNTFNVSSNTEISLLDIIIPKAKAEGTVPPLNNFITVKGDKPKSGTITLNEKGKVTEAIVSLNSYYVQCSNNECNASKSFDYKISYDSNGGSGKMETSFNVVSNNTFSAPSGMHFDSWNTKNDGSGVSYAPDDKIDINLKLYAQWKYNSYTLGQNVKIKGTDWFMMENSDENKDTVRIISKWNINKDVTLSTTKNNLFIASANDSRFKLKFDVSGSNIYANSTIKTRLEGEFKHALESVLNISINSIGMLGFQEFSTLQCSVNQNYPSIDCSKSPYLNTVIKGTMTWTNCIYNVQYKTLFALNSDGTFGAAVDPTSDTWHGVRPIIIISKEYLDN